MPIVLRNLETHQPVYNLQPTRLGATVEREAKRAGTSCCGGDAPAGADACCSLDAEEKAAGNSGCGCGTPSANPKSSGCC
jgi:hypothetical protein